jgi:hypothetical protein
VVSVVSPILPFRATREGAAGDSTTGGGRERPFAGCRRRAARRRKRAGASRENLPGIHRSPYKSARRPCLRIRTGHRLARPAARAIRPPPAWSGCQSLARPVAHAIRELPRSPAVRASQGRLPARSAPPPPGTAVAARTARRLPHCRALPHGPAMPHAWPCRTAGRRPTRCRTAQPQGLCPGRPRPGRFHFPASVARLRGRPHGRSPHC